jgi:hypothetical protein
MADSDTSAAVPARSVVRTAELPFDLIEWRFPQTGSVTAIPCRLYARWNTFRIGHETIDEFTLTPDE